MASDASALSSLLERIICLICFKCVEHVWDDEPRWVAQSSVIPELFSQKFGRNLKIVQDLYNIYIYMYDIYI